LYQNARARESQRVERAGGALGDGGSGPTFAPFHDASIDAPSSPPPSSSTSSAAAAASAIVSWCDDTAGEKTIDDINPHFQQDTLRRASTLRQTASGKYTTPGGGGADGGLGSRRMSTNLPTGARAVGSGASGVSSSSKRLSALEQHEAAASAAARGETAPPLISSAMSTPITPLAPPPPPPPSSVDGGAPQQQQQQQLQLNLTPGKRVAASQGKGFDAQTVQMASSLLNAPLPPAANARGARGREGDDGL